MNIKSPSFCFSYLLLTLSILVNVTFFAWLYMDTEEQKAHALYVEFERLGLNNKISEARQLLRDELDREPNAPISIYMYSMVQLQSDSTEKLGYLVRILKENPQLEYIYQDIASLNKKLSASISHEQLRAYLLEISSIPNVNLDFIKKYQLSPYDTPKSHS